ncbi:MAG TPA: class I SAM-dependent methyltransferase [Dissulfurispiraceae bacterium]|nr:class I SAM-dependent methyltransferase [Dissulfurispiraceae bacterium]
MSYFTQSNWANPEFSQDYRDNADIYIVERMRMLSILQSFYLNLVKNDKKSSLLDIGCGDGIVTSAIVEVDRLISVTLVDGSEDMLLKAKERLNGFTNAQYIHATFQDMIHRDIIDGKFNIVASSMAIHHLAKDEKAEIFKRIYAYLEDGGYFINIDVVLSPCETLEVWYLKLWQEWMDQKKRVVGIKDNQFPDIITRYKENKDNKPDTLEDQLTLLEDSGFKDVDCYYKYGIFTIYGGRKPV